jgi:hypothetical protein
MISAEWQVTVQNRLPGRPLVTLDGPMVEEALRLIELQADAGIPAVDRDFVGYVANVLFDDWDQVWVDAPRACAAAGPLCVHLIALAVDCERFGDHAAADRLLARAAQVAGGDGRRCLVSYRAIAWLAFSTHEWQADGDSAEDTYCAAVSAILDRLQAAGGA